MSQSTVIIGALAFGFVLYITIAGHLSTYVQVLTGGGAQQNDSLSSSGSSGGSGGALGGLGSSTGGGSGAAGGLTMNDVGQYAAIAAMFA